MLSRKSATVCLIGVFLAVCLIGDVHANEKDYSELDSIFNEKECIHQGGICVIEKDCPEGFHTAVKGLCPEQRSKGVECCYGFSVKESRCTKRGGNCMPAEQCHFAPKAPEATDCLPSDVCCILVS